MRVFVTLFVVGVATSQGCAPSHRMVHEGNVYFEDCYGADFNPRIRDADREACWNAWLAHYTRHQPAHRIDYALRRVEALQAGEPPLVLPGISEDGATAVIDPNADGLVTLQGPRAGAEANTILEHDAAPVAHGCGQACGGVETQCLARCASTDLACRDGCALDRSTCLGGCY